MNVCHYTGSEMSLQQAAALLGYTQASWDNASGAEAQPASASKKWADLNQTERSAAAVLGYTEQTWGTFSKPKMSWSALTNSVVTSTTDTSRDEPEVAQLQESNSETSSPIPAVFAGVAVVIVVVVIVLVVFYFILRKKKSARSKVAALGPPQRSNSFKVINVTARTTQGPRTRAKMTYW